jgi:hypothetical protein
MHRDGITIRENTGCVKVLLVENRKKPAALQRIAEL